MIGYDDRVKGPMEIALDDFVRIAQGGDIPEHRIWYFRCSPLAPPTLPTPTPTTTAPPPPAMRLPVATTPMDQQQPRQLSAPPQDGVDSEERAQGIVSVIDNDENDDDDMMAQQPRLNDAQVNDMILWDRLGRVDKLFGSGVGKDSHKISPTTTQLVRMAMANMQQMEAERLERRQWRDHERRRLASKRQARKQQAVIPGVGICCG